MSTPKERLTQNLPLWKKPGVTITNAKDKNMIEEDPTILFQLLFGLYVANSKYGFNPTSVGDFQVKKEVKHTMVFALESGGDYDVFTFETEHHVVLDYPITAAETKQDLDTTAIANTFSVLLDKTPAGQRLKAQLSDVKQDYGTGMPWGPNLALFHPFFYSYYSGEATTKLAGIADEMIYLHEPKWTMLEKTLQDARSKEVEDAFKSVKTYKLEDFKDVIQNLLAIYKKLEDNPATHYPNKYATMNELSKELQEEYQSILTVLNGNYTVVGLGNIPTFTSGADELVAYLPDKKITPWGSSGQNIDHGRAKGYVIILLSIIGKIVSNSNYFISSDSTKEIEVMNVINGVYGFDPLKWKTDFEKIYKNYDDYFNSSKNAIQKLRDDYTVLETTYNTYQKSIVFRADKHPLLKTKLDDANRLIKDLTDSNFTTNEATARQALVAAQGDQSEWKRQAEASVAEQKQYDAIKSRLDALQKEYNDTKTAYDRYESYMGTPLRVIDLNTLETTNDFQNDVQSIEQKILDARNVELKDLLNALKQKQDNDTLKQQIERLLDTVDNMYKNAEKSYNNAMAQTKDQYMIIWNEYETSSPTTGTTGLVYFVSNAKTTLETVRGLNATAKFNISAWENKYTEMMKWPNEVKTRASEYHREYVGAKLEKDYVAVGVSDGSVQSKIDDFKNDANRTKKELLEKQDEIQNDISQLAKTKRDAEKAEQEKRVSEPIKIVGKPNVSEVVWTNVLEGNFTQVEKTKGVTDEFKELLKKKDNLSISRAAAGEVALNLDVKKNPEQKRKLLAFSQMFV